MGKAPAIIIPKEHQASPTQGQIYLPHQVSKHGLYTPNEVVSDTILRSRLQVKESPIEGLGLFADHNYRKHDLIWKEVLRGDYAKPESDGPLRWANHSDGPNSALILSLDGILETSLIAIKDIEIGEEITYDYNIFGHTGYEKKCNCGNPNCKGSFVLRTEWDEKK